MASFNHNREEFKGKLFVVEGVEGAGKTTQLNLLQRWLESKGYAVNYTRRRTSKLVSKTIESAKANKTLTPITYSLIHAADFADRLYNLIIPALKAGIIVLADIYIYTSFARDIVRGNSREWVKELYSFALPPDGVVYLRVPIDICFGRSGPERIREFYDSGMDTGLSSDPEESFRMFHDKIIQEFEDWMLDEYKFNVIDGTKPIHIIQHELRKYIDGLLRGKAS